VFFGSLSIDYSFLIAAFSIVIIFSIYYYIAFKQLINVFNFKRKIFWISFIIRACVVIIYYFIFLSVTKTPFEVTFADSIFYDEIGQKIANEIRTLRLNFSWLFYKREADDTGYGFFLGGLYTLFNDSIFLTRIVQALISSYTVVLAYKIGKSIWSEKIGRYTAILFSGFHTFILYASLHLREFLMVYVLFFLIYKFIKYKESSKFNQLVLILIGIVSLLFLRTVIVVVFIAAVGIYTFLMERKSTKRMVLSSLIFIGFVLVIFNFSFFDSTATKLLGYVGIEDNVKLGGYTEERVMGTGMSFAQYVIGPIVIIPSLIFPIPSLLKLSIEQFGQSMHWYFTGGLIMWIFFSLFYFKGILQSIKDRNKNAIFIIILIFLYAIVLVKSFYFPSIRFNQIKMPLLLLFVPYGMTLLKNRKVNYIMYFILASSVILLYNYLRISGRGL
jgi:4-amino-4-deoxy-L-arabinose transferase-like glycosyltransferase